MSILIKGMEMPKNCWEDDCPCLDRQYGMCQADSDKRCVYSNRPDWCPLVSVQPHGRLIDADALYEQAVNTAEHYRGFFNAMEKVISARNIEQAPTIIEAEGEEG